MAARLTVFLSQSARSDVHMADLEQTLVAELMMRPGLDATMIGPIERIEPGDTDFLCVSSFNHSFAILSWLAPEDLDEQWRRLGLSGHIVDPLQARMARANNHCIYHFQLKPNLDIGQTLGALSRILADRNVKTVSIDLLANPGAEEHSSAVLQADDGRSATMDATGHEIQKQRDATIEAKNRPANNHLSSEQRSRPTSTASIGVPESEDDGPTWNHLEELVDDFDSLDL